MKRLLLVLSLPSLIALAACQGGNCSYATIAGTCVINQIGVADAGTHTTFIFTPADGGTASTSQPLADLDLVGGDTPTEPSAACLASNDITLNASLSCSEQSETSGACTPKIFVIPSFNDQASGCP